MQAVRRFDPHRGVRLVAYAAYWIRAQILDYVLRNWRIVKVATTKARRKLFYLNESADEWLDDNIVDISSDRIRQVSIQHADGEKITLEKTARDDTNFAVTDIPAGRELSYASVGNGIAGVLPNLAFDEVRKAQAAATSEIDLINARLAGWEYRVADHEKNLFVTRWEDILKDRADSARPSTKSEPK